MLAAGKVVFWRIDEGQTEVEHQVDDQRASTLC